VSPPAPPRPRLTPGYSSKIIYSPRHSLKGALLSTLRQPKKKDALQLLLSSRLSSRQWQAETSDRIVAPHSLPLYRPSKKAKKEALKPEAPSTNKVKIGGQSSVSRNFTQFVVEGMLNKKKCISGKNDPREELFKYSEGRSFVDVAYLKGGKGPLAEKTIEEEEEESNKKT